MYEIENMEIVRKASSRQHKEEISTLFDHLHLLDCTNSNHAQLEPLIELFANTVSRSTAKFVTVKNPNLNFETICSIYNNDVLKIPCAFWNYESEAGNMKPKWTIDNSSH